MQRYAKILLSAIGGVMTGCASPIPRDMEFRQQRAREDYLAVRDVVKAGDIIFRMGRQPIFGGLVDFSKTSAQMADSDFSHASIVIQAHNGESPRTNPSAGLLVADATVYGVERKFFRDWHITGTRNLVVKRLKPEYWFLIPQVLETVGEILERDALYNENFVYNDEKFYCSQMVDFAFRINGYPLSDLVSIRDFPNYGPLFHGIGCLISGIDPGEKVAVPGNDRIGLFSSAMLETVIDLRTQK